jgi:hypothetical protein
MHSVAASSHAHEVLSRALKCKYAMGKMDRRAEHQHDIDHEYHHVAEGEKSTSLKLASGEKEK